MVAQNGIATPGETHTVSELLDAYEREYVVSQAPTTRYQKYRMYIFFRAELGHLRLDELTPQVLRQWRDSMSARFTQGTVRRYMDLLSGPLTIAVNDYEWLARNPLHQVRKPPEAPGRERVLMADEQTRLLESCKQSRNPHLYCLTVLALATGARKNELLERQWSDIDLEQGVLRIQRSKTGIRRNVPITGLALDVLRQQWARRCLLCPWVFPRFDGTRPVELHRCWAEALRRASIEDMHFHDLRHTAASRMAMSGASLLDIATVLGHASMQMAKKYSHLTDSHTSGIMARMTSRYLIDATQEGASDGQS